MILVLKGIPASGKSTFARAWVSESPTTRVRINNDDIRSMLGPYWVTSREELVGELWKDMLHEALTLNYDVVLDNMNLDPHVNDYIKSIADRFHVKMEVKTFFIPVEECISRDKGRPNSVGEKVIMGVYNRYKSILHD